MGSIKTKAIKKAAQQLKKTYPDKFSADFEKNKEFLNELKIISEKPAKNKIAGYIVRLCKIEAMRQSMKR
ncbi:MAG: 30S ribosomal protein S17e [Candidatus Aenigmarchaeota archaeon]|nr:30S ribosomal protein S17e [Candidatus Aenigmarchaeota archaeon]MDI6722460.1 30S ribosomal protein S17e [Candidatus Aenigmarchaeota archaeon]